MSNATTQQTDGFETSFAEELEQLEYYSHGDFVEIEIVAVERTGDRTAEVTFDPPVGDEFTVEMDVPVDPSGETEFTRLLHECGRNFGNANGLIGDRVKAHYEEDGWDIEYSEPEQTRWEQASDYLSSFLSASLIASVLAWWPVAGLVVLTVLVLDPDEVGDEEHEEWGIGSAAIIYGIVLAIWLIATAALTTVLETVGIHFPIEVTLTV